MIAADAFEHLIGVGISPHTLGRNGRGGLVPADPPLRFQLFPLALRHQHHGGAGIGHLGQGLVGLLQQAVGGRCRAALGNESNAVSAAQNAEDQVVLPLQPLGVKEENGPLVAAVQRIQNLAEPLGIFTGKGQIRGDDVGVHRVVRHGDVGVRLFRIVGGRQHTGGWLALVGLVIVPDAVADGVLGRVYKAVIAEHHTGTLDAHNIALFNVDHGVGQPKIAAHRSHRHIGPPIAQDGPAGQCLLGKRIIAGPPVEIEHYHLLESIEGHRALVPAVAAADAKIYAGIAAVKDGVGYIQHTIGPGGHGIRGQFQQIFIHRGQVDIPRRLGCIQQRHQHGQHQHQRRAPLPSFHRLCLLSGTC